MSTFVRTLGLGGATALLCSALTACGGREPVAEEKADLVLRNGTVVTMAQDRPNAEAVAIIGDRIVEVGENADVESFIGEDTEILDLEGRLAVPGFIEGHGHFMSLGNAKMILDLTKVNDWNEIVTMVGDAASDAEPGAWIQGRGWHQEKWAEVPPGAVEGLPTHMGLSEVSPDNPVLLGHASGHAAFVNAKAMELAGIDDDTPDPEGGTIVRDAEGKATGALRETAQRLVRRAFADYQKTLSAEELRSQAERAVELASQELLSKGVTSFQDAGADFEIIDFLKGMAEEGRLPVRLYIMVRGESNDVMAEKLPDYKMIDEADHHITVRSIKRQIDGALGAHGAWLLEPYEDMPESTGLVLEPVEEIARTAEIALEHGFQVNTHAIGDRANREVLDIYEKAFAAVDDGPQRRFRIEHAQHIHPDDIPRFKELGVIASMQGVHCTSDAPWVFKRLGAERAESGAYVWRELIEAGVVVTNGTDVPVEDADPLPSFYASITRKTKDGMIFFPEQVMTRVEALRSYTLDAAYSAFEETSKGSIAKGKLADIVVLSKNIMTIPADEILGTKVTHTIVGGKILYRADGVSDR